MQFHDSIVRVCNVCVCLKNSRTRTLQSEYIQYSIAFQTETEYIRLSKLETQQKKLIGKIN